MTVGDDVRSDLSRTGSPDERAAALLPGDRGDSLITRADHREPTKLGRYGLNSWQLVRAPLAPVQQ
jgi:hypothetical protein